MGCDIHAYIEWRNNHEMNPRWDGTRSVVFYRNYGMFYTMAGVRGEGGPLIFEPRGIPRDISGRVLREYTLIVIDGVERVEEEGTCTREDAEKYSKYHPYWDEEHRRINHPDWHTPSWLTLEEFRLAYKRYRDYYKEYPLPAFMTDASWAKMDKDEREKAWDGWIKSEEETKEMVPVRPVPEIEALFAYMEAFEKFGYEVRIVFWFDN